MSERFSDTGQRLGAPLVISHVANAEQLALGNGGRFAAYVPETNETKAHVEVWDVAARRLVHTLSQRRVIAQPAPVDGVQFTPDSQNVISWNHRGEAWLWNACQYCENPRMLLRLARSRVTRSLTAAERAELPVP